MSNYSLPGSSPWNSPGKNTGVGCHFLLQGNFLTQELNSSLPHCRQMLYWLSYKGSFEVKVAQKCPTLCNPMDCGIFQARKLEWAAFPFSSGSSQPRDRTQVSCIVGTFFTSWVMREAPKCGDVGDWTRGLIHAKHVLYHWATSPIPYMPGPKQSILHSLFLFTFISTCEMLEKIYIWSLSVVPGTERLKPLTFA